MERLFDLEAQSASTGPVECLGITFPSDKERREYFLERLREKLSDPEFRKIEGFPIGSDEDILALSDPPYYTACPNPFIGDFIRCYGTPYDPNVPYSREPFAADVSEGKNDPIYNAHSYHTKVPHKAVMRYILHYTEPGDIVFDGFCGSGMTGVAAQLCGDREAVESLGYKIDNDGVVYDVSVGGNGETVWREISKLGSRRAILNDLSPAATFIADNYANLHVMPVFAVEALRVTARVENELRWLYEGVSGGRVLNAVWSDVFLCPNCSRELIYWDAALAGGILREAFPCTHCTAILGKAPSRTSGAAKLERAFVTSLDPVLNKTVRVPKLTLVQQTVDTRSTRVTAPIDSCQEDPLQSRFHGVSWPPVPTDEFFPGRQTNKLINGSGISHICHMYTPRALFAYGHLWQCRLSSYRHTSLFAFCLSAINNYISRKQGYFGGGGGVSGTLFTPSIHLERNVFDVLKRKIKRLSSLAVARFERTCLSTQSVSGLRNIPSGQIDYVFTDPPFGESLQYAELNMFVEAWLKIKTAVGDDCVINYVHNKDLLFYSNIMSTAFREYYRILKPGRWMTVEFHNSRNAVWSVIQQAMESSGLVVADVRVLDKKQRSFNAVNRAGAVNQDLVISAYKPNRGLEDRFKLTAGSEDGVWDFVRTHLAQLPVFVASEGRAEIIAERQNYLLFDRMVAFHVQRGVTVPLSAGEFYAGLEQRFPSREGMYFLPEQAAEYDKKRMSVQEVAQLQLFVTDESSAIQWLKQQLAKKPQTFQELHPQFLKETGGWQKHEKPLELSQLLEQNFLRYDGRGEVPSQIHSYLSTNFKELRNLPKDAPDLMAKARDRWYVPDPNKAGDLERLRERSLLREFEEYRESKQRRLKVFRLEAVRAGFKRAWQERDYSTIIAVAGKIPENVLQEDPKLLMWYDQALTRTGGNA